MAIFWLFNLAIFWLFFWLFFGYSHFLAKKIAIFALSAFFA